MKLKIVWIGRLKEREFREYEAELKKRLAPFANLTDVCVADEKEIFGHINKNERLYVLDARGRQVDSKQFSGFLSGENPVFLIGPHSGFSDNVRTELEKKGSFISLSRLTFPHRLCKIILIEQIYRGFCIINNLPYAK